MVETLGTVLLVLLNVELVRKHSARGWRGLLAALGMAGASALLAAAMGMHLERALVAAGVACLLTWCREHNAARVR